MELSINDDFYKLDDNLLASLTLRERQVAAYILQGHANKYIAVELGVSRRTIEAHRSRIFTKMGVRNAVQLAALEPLRQCLQFVPATSYNSAPVCLPVPELDQCQLDGSDATVTEASDCLYAPDVIR